MDSKDVKSIYPCAPPYEDAIQMNYPAPVIQNQILPSNNLPANAVMAPTHVVVREAANNTQICSYCHAPLYTETRYRTNGHTHLMALLCCVCFCCLCAPFVYCMDSCREPRLHCRKCKQMVM